MFYEGIVEADNVEYGYCKVRIFGKHTHDRSILPTEDLPNAKIVYSGESCIDELSYFRTIKNGSWVIVGFLDKDEQHPIILGSVVKTVETLPNFDDGFSDPNGAHPSQTGTTISAEAVSDYPNNRVLKTEQHLIEINDATSKINILSGGDINLNGDTDSAVAFTDMQTAFDLLKQELNNFIIAYNLHIHVTTATIGGSPTPGVLSPTVAQAVSATADMSGAQVPTVKLP